MPKKAYALDFDIYYAKDRNTLVKQIIQQLEHEGKTLSETDINQLADYILFGKDEYHMSPVDTHEILQPHKRYTTYVRKEDKNASLDAMLDDPITGPQLELENHEVSPKNRSILKTYKPSIKRTTYDENGNILERGDDFDADGNVIQPMRDLWECIDRWQEIYDMYSGKIPPNESVRLRPKTKYDVYRINHMLIDMKRQQYVIKDAYKPTLHSFNPPGSTKTSYDFDTPTGYWLTPEEWDRRAANPKPKDIEQDPKESVRTDAQNNLFWEVGKNVLDYENPFHMNVLLDHYASLLRHSYDKPDSLTRCICYDIERFIEKAHLSEVEQFVLEQKVAHKNMFHIQQIIEAETGEIYSECRLRQLMKHTIPQKLADAAKELRMESQMSKREIETLRCTKCKRWLPKNLHYFAKSRDKKTGFCSQCKECQRIKRAQIKEAKNSGNNRT